MTSAERVIDLRHSALARRRMAEMSVPAWLIPMKKTKLVMYTPQKIGLASPVTPRPSRYWWRYAHTAQRMIATRIDKVI